MDPIVARLNIEYFRRRLAIETDEVTREKILRLLAEEEAKLAACATSPEMIAREKKRKRA